MINNHHHTCGIKMPFGAWRFSLALKCIAGMMIMADCLPSPRNASYVWTDPFHVNVTWQRPGGLDSSKRCCYYVTGLEIKIIKDTFYKECVTTDEMADSGLNYTIATICRSTDQYKSSPVNVVIPRPPTLLKDVGCFLHSSSVMNCSWTWTPLGSSLPDMKVYYRSCDNLASSNLIACKNLYSNGCYLDTSRYRVDLTADICVLINGTLGGAPVWNTFRRKPLGKVRTRPPKVTMTAIGNQLGLSWTPQQDIQDTDACWNYIVSYSKCKEPVREVTESGLMLNITYDERCQYKVQVRATFLQSCGGEGGSDNSEAVMHGVDAPPDMSVMLAIIIPVLVSASLSVLACYCFRRHRAILWPMIPSPKVGTWIFKDLVENSKEQRTTKGNSYEPVEVDLEFCKICLVMDEGSPREGS